MIQWKVEYQGADKRTVHAKVVSVPDEYATAQQVKEAVEAGKLPDLYVAAGTILSVSKYYAPRLQTRRVSFS